jgi:hypothetical protein
MCLLPVFVHMVSLQLFHVHDLFTMYGKNSVHALYFANYTFAQPDHWLDRKGLLTFFMLILSMLILLYGLFANTVHFLQTQASPIMKRTVHVIVFGKLHMLCIIC